MGDGEPGQATEEIGLSNPGAEARPSYRQGYREALRHPKNQASPTACEAAPVYNPPISGCWLNFNSNSASTHFCSLQGPSPARASMITLSGESPCPVLFFTQAC